MELLELILESKFLLILAVGVVVVVLAALLIAFVQGREVFLLATKGGSKRARRFWKVEIAVRRIR